MRARLIRLAGELRESYWFVPTIMAVAALLLAAAMVWLDSHHATAWMDRLPWLYAARPEGARSLLSSIGGSMIGVAGTTFSVTIAAVVYASGQYGPRLLSNFMSDRGNQVTLGTFIATFLYSLVVVRTIRSPGEQAGEAAFVPQLAVLVGVLLVLCSIAVLIYFIHHVPSRIHINSVIERIGDRLLADFSRRYPIGIGEPLDPADDEARIPAALRLNEGADHHQRRDFIEATETGYIQLVDEEKLIESARQNAVVLRLRHRPGDFVHLGSTLFDISPAGAMTDETIMAIRDTVAIGSRRTALQDMRFFIDELVEIAARALSPGVNDPFTANSCLDWLGAAMADLARRSLPSSFRADEDGTLRVIACPVTFEGFVYRSFGALAQYASADMIAARHYLTTISDVMRNCQDAGRRATLTRMVEDFRELAEESLKGFNCRDLTQQVNRLLLRR
ncbi:DUF2254 domain-containing protein [Sphingomonas sp. 1P08PE]|uniref:DUF2254 domain-containing protein n=1 Tax=Sphingomonas sp. 1P08PE TaxID=554122 RepID=UPI00399F456A